ncbi:MAG: XTP/dITP diphosphatase [Spirochaetota bacterium]|nr:XTP/dITP diphosphatase [Spirochaetota bacterium]
MKLVIATRNNDKIREISDRFKSIPEIELLSLKDYDNSPDIVEDGATFFENALKKARLITAFTGQASLADDSGLEIDALGGEPGIYSARYAGDNATDTERNMLVLDKMKDIPEEKRGAKFISVIAVTFPDKTEYTTYGECKGIISFQMIGHEGFGYDPIFYLPDFGKTMAQLSLSEKNSISHRAKALEQIEIRLKKILKNNSS